MRHHGTPQETREPCPDRIIGDLGGAFAMGTIGSGLNQFSKGTVGGPNGRRISNAFQQVRINSARCGGSFAVWGGLFSSFDCTIVYFRQREDPWNSIAAGAAAGGILALRQGPRAAGLSASLGGCLLAMIEGVMILANRFQNPELLGGYQQPEPQPQQEMDDGLSSGWGLFGRMKKKNDTQYLQSFDTPYPPDHYEYN